MQFRHHIIGSGPAGEGAAMRLAKTGQRLAVIEAHAQVGGGCTHWGTSPSKTPRHTIQMLADYRRDPLFHHTLDQVDIDFPDLLRAADGVIGHQVRTRYRDYQRNRVEVLFGRAGLLHADHQEVTRPNDAADQLEATCSVMATGSRPNRPSHPQRPDDHVPDWVPARRGLHHRILLSASSTTRSWPRPTASPPSTAWNGCSEAR